jgi:hypothetical protein
MSKPSYGHPCPVTTAERQYIYEGAEHNFIRICKMTLAQKCWAYMTNYKIYKPHMKNV